MKKKAVKLATASAIVASAFAATSVSAAENTVNVDQLVKEAEKHAGALKWAISAEFTADGKTRPDALHNLTKSALDKAKAAVAKTSGKEKTVYETRLDFVEQQVERSTHYMDAIRASQKVQAKTADLNKAVADKNIDNVIKAHHALTAEVRKQAVILYRVYGQSTRDLILAQTKTPAEKAVAATKVDVTVQTHLNNAVDAIGKGELETASQQIAKADSWINQASSLKELLEQNRSDVYSALNLGATNVKFVDNNTVEVRISKAASPLLAADDFHFNNGLEVTAIKSISADGKTITLTTTKQKDGETYKLYFKGVPLHSFTNPPSIPPIDVEAPSKLVERKNAGENRVISASLENINGTKYTGDVDIYVRTVTDTSRITAIDGNNSASVITPVEETTLSDGSKIYRYNAVVGIDGRIDFTLTSDSSNESDFVEIEIAHVDENGNKLKDLKEVKIGDTYFYEKADRRENVLDTKQLADNENGFNFYKNVAENYFVYYEGAEGAAVLDNKKKSNIEHALKYSYDSNDVFYINDRRATLDEFEKELSSGDHLTVDYKPGNISTFHLTSNVSRPNELEIVTPNNVVRYDGSNYRVSGKGQPGYKVQLFADANSVNQFNFRDDVLVGEATIGADGTWVVQAATLGQNQINNFIAVQYAPNEAAADYNGQYGKTVGTNINHPNVEVVSPIYEGAFALTSVEHFDNGDYLFGINDTLKFEFSNNPTYGHELKVADGATITLTDARGREAVLTVAEHKATTAKDDVVIKSIKLDNGFGLGSLNVTATTGLTNQDNQVLDLSASDLDEEQFKPKHPVPGVLVDGPTPSK